MHVRVFSEDILAHIITDSKNLRELMDCLVTVPVDEFNNCSHILWRFSRDYRSLTWADTRLTLKCPCYSETFVWPKGVCQKYEKAFRGSQQQTCRRLRRICCRYVAPSSRPSWPQSGPNTRSRKRVYKLITCRQNDAKCQADSEDLGVMAVQYPACI